MNEEKFEPVNSKGKDVRRGLNLTYRSLAAILKYDSPIKLRRRSSDELSKGYYQSERELVAAIKKHVAPSWSAGANGDHEFKTIECSIMDIADDIAYSTYDLEDALKGGFISPLHLLSTIAKHHVLRNRITEKVNRAIRKRNRSLQNHQVGEISEEKVLSVVRSGPRKLDTGLSW